MKPQYAVVIAALAVTLGYVVGIGQGRSDESTSWRRAMLSVPDDACRDAVRDALRAEPIQ